MYAKLAKSETPTNIFKLEIRRKHRQQIRRDIMNQFQQLSQFQLCLEALCDMAEAQLIETVNKKEDRGKFSEQNNEGGYKRCTLYNNNVDGHQFSDQYIQTNNPWDFVKLAKLAQQLSYLLNALPDKWIQQMLYKEQELRHQPVKVYLDLQTAITIYIPHLIYVIEEIERAQSSRLEYENKKYLWPHLAAESDILPNQFAHVQLGAINTIKFVNNLISILMKLAYVYDLRHAFIFTNPCQTNSSSSFYPYIYHQCYELEPLRLLTRNLMSFILPDENFYASLISIGNILHHLEGDNKSKDRLKDADIRRQLGLDSGDNLYKHVYQVLLDSDIQSILAVSLTKLIDQQQNQIINRLADQPHQNSQEVLIWFISSYSKFLYARSFPIYRLQLLYQKIQSYIYNKLKSLQQSTSKSPLNKTQQTLLKHITSLIEHLNIKFQNLIIINTVIPLLRRNLHEFVISKLWLYLTYNGDYDLNQLFNIEFQQVHIFNNRDKVTVKYQRFYENIRDSISNQQQRDDKQGRVNEYDNQITFRPPPTINPTSRILQEIFTTVLQNHDGKYKQRNINLMQGVFNILLQVQNQQALHLWRSIFSQKQEFNEIFQIKEIQPILTNIEDYLDTIRE